jgi:GNAT superfamily N-acetyltransferase
MSLSRVIRTRDRPLILKMEQVCFNDESLDEDDAREHIWFVAFVNGKPAGYAGLKTWDGFTGFLSRAGVLPEFRGLGLQKRLIKSRQRYAKRIGIRWLVTYTAIDSAASQNSLISCGYRPYRPEYPWAGAEWIYFRRKL